MSTVFNLPDLGEGLTDSEIVSWLVAEGDTVKLNQPLAEVETAKATVEVPSPYAGMITKLHAAAGETVLVGAPLVEFEITGKAETQKTTQEETQQQKTQQNDRLDVLVGSVRINKGDIKRTPRVWDTKPYVRDPLETAAKTVQATPPARIFAKQQNINLSEVPHSGEMITRKDIESYVKDWSGDTPARKRESVRIEPVQGIRKHSAQAMVKSYSEIPHATVFLDVDVTATLELLENLKTNTSLKTQTNLKAQTSSAPSFLSLVSRAVVRAAKLVPETNASFLTNENAIKYFDAINLGIAMDTPNGLVVASIENANHLNAYEITAQITRLREKALASKLTPNELTSSTITISNVGVFGVDSGAPIINPGQSLILALGAIRRKPWEFKNEIALRSVVTLAAAFDHRIIDGAEASEFITAVGEVLEKPGIMFVG